MFLRSIAIALIGLCLCSSPILLAQDVVADGQSAGNKLVSASVQEAAQNEAASNIEVAANIESLEEQNVSVETPKKDQVPQWIWGEVVSVEEANKQIVIKHLDYETYEDVQTTLKVDDKSVFENVSGLSDIRPKDHITVDYNIKDNVNIAELVVVDKEQAMIMDEPAVSVEEGAGLKEETGPVAGVAANQLAQEVSLAPAQAKQ